MEVIDGSLQVVVSGGGGAAEGAPAAGKSQQQHQCHSKLTDELFRRAFEGLESLTEGKYENEDVCGHLTGRLESIYEMCKGCELSGENEEMMER